MSIGGRTYGEPVLAKHSDGRLEVFVIGLDGYLFRKRQAGPSQAFGDAWVRMSTNFHAFPAYNEEVVFDPLTTRIAWALHQNGTMYVFGRTLRGRLVYAYGGPSGDFSDWKSIAAVQDGHPAMGNPAAASALTGNDAILLAVRAKTGAILTRRLGSSVDDWGDPNEWTNHDGISSSEPAVAKSFAGSTFYTSIYVRGLDGCLYGIREVVRLGGSIGAPFGTWQRLFDDRTPGAKLTGQPVITEASAGVIWRGVNGNLWTINQRAIGTFGAPSDLGSASASDPAYLISGGDSWLFWQSPGAQLMMRRRRAGAPPENPVSLTSGLGVRVISKPSVNISADGRVEAVFVGSDGAVYHLWETAVGSGSFEEGP